MERRCYLCGHAGELVEDPDNKDRKFWIECRKDEMMPEPCHECDSFIEIKKEDITDGSTRSLEKEL